MDNNNIEMQQKTNDIHPNNEMQVIQKKEKLEINDRKATETERNLLMSARGMKIGVPSDMELSWENVNISAQIRGKNKKLDDKLILNNVEGRVKSGECLAIIGSSGAGKTTLLNYLSRKIESTTLKMEGKVLLNGQKTENDKFDYIATYVMQDDILEAVMTPLEILFFTAKLKLVLPIDQIELKVKKMIEDLHLTKCKDTMIGGPLTRGVSGGERKRTSIAVELISDPKIVFLDEPTTGLDSYNAYEVVQLLGNLSKTGKIIVYTIHQPSSEIFDLLDKLCVLALGKTVYFGPSNKSIQCFESSKLTIPNNYNPFEYFMEVTNVTAVSDSKVVNEFGLAKYNTDGEKHEALISSLNDNYEKNKMLYLEQTNFIDGFSEENERLFKEKNIQKNFCYQLSMLFGKNILIAKRHKSYLVMKVVQSCITAILMAIVFTRLSKDFSGIQDRLGLILLCLVSSVLSPITALILVFADERKVFMRERSNKLYSILAYFIAKTFAELPIFIIANNLFALIVYHATVLNDIYSYKYYVFIGILNFLTVGATSWAFFIGSALSSNPEALINLNTALTIPLLLLSGFFANASNFAPYLIPIKYLSLFKYGFQMMTHNEFEDSSAYNCQNTSDMCQPMPARFTFLEPYFVSFLATGALILLFKSLALFFVYKFAKIRV